MSARDRLLSALAASPEVRPGMEAELVAEVVAERDGQIMAWLGKKAAEYRSTHDRLHTAHADVLDKMASKIARGAVRTPAAAPGPQPELSDTARQLLTFGLTMVTDRMASWGDEFDADGQRAMAELRGLATPARRCGCAYLDERLRPCEPCKYADLDRRFVAALTEARAAGQAPAAQPGTCGLREAEPRSGTSPCVMAAGHGGGYHQDKWTNRWPVSKTEPAPQPETARGAVTVIPGPDTASGPYVTLLVADGSVSVAPELSLSRAAALADELRAAVAEAGKDSPPAESTRCTCARSWGLHSKDCARYVPGHELAARTAGPSPTLLPSPASLALLGCTCDPDAKLPCGHCGNCDRCEDCGHCCATGCTCKCEAQS